MNKILTRIATAFVGIAMAIGVGVAIGNNSKQVQKVEATEQTWSAQTNCMGTSSPTSEEPQKSGTTGVWSYTRTAVVTANGGGGGGMDSGYVQVGKNGGVENLRMSTTSYSSYVITKVEVDCASYNSKHTIAITVNNVSYLTATATAKWENKTGGVSTGTGNQSGEIVILFNGSASGARAMYIKSIKITYQSSEPSVTFSRSNYNLFNDENVTLEGTCENVSSIVLTCSDNSKASVGQVTITNSTSFSATLTPESGATGVVTINAYLATDVNHETSLANCTVSIYEKDGDDTITFAKYFKENEAYFTEEITKPNFKIAFSNNNGRYYVSDLSARMYANGTLTFTALNSKKFNKITFGFTSNSGGAGNLSVTSGGGTYSSKVWTAENATTSSVVFGASAALRLTSITVEFVPTDPAVLSVSLSSNREYLYVNGGDKTVTLTATVIAINQASEAVSWSTSSDSIAAVSNGVVTAVGDGIATITATSVFDGTKTAACRVRVFNRPDSEYEITFGQQGYTNDSVVNDIDKTNFSVEFTDGHSQTKYFDDGESFRLYGNNNDKFATMTVSSNIAKKIVRIDVTFGTGGTSGLDFTADSGLYNSGVWTGSADSVVLTVGTGATGHIRVARIVIAFETEDPIQVWIDAYMKMNDSSFDGKGSGVCKTGGYYVTAKAALLDLDSEYVDAFRDDEGGKYTDALERYLAWATYCKDSTPFEGEGIVLAGNQAIKLNKTQNDSTTIVLIAIISTVAVGAFFIIRKKKEQ